MNGSDRICHEKFCDSFFYATENIFEKWIEGKYRQRVVGLIRRKSMNYDVIIIGAGPGGIFAAYELMKEKPDCKVAVF